MGSSGIGETRHRTRNSELPRGDTPYTGADAPKPPVVDRGETSEADGRETERLM